MPTIEELKANLEQIDTELRSERYKGGDADQSKIAQLEQQYQDVQAQINQTEVAVASDAIAPSTDEIKVGNDIFSIDDLAAGPDEAMFLRQWIRQIRMTASEQASANVAALQAAKDEVVNVRSQLIDANTEIKYLTGARDAAMEKADELQAEVDRLNSLVEDMQKEKAVGVRAAIDVIEVRTEEDAKAAVERIKARRAEEARIAKEAAEAAKIRVYDLQDGDLKRSFYTAKRSDNDETINIPALELAKYVVLSNEEAERFREERQAAEKALVESVPAAEENSEPLEPPEVPQFQYDETTDAQPTDGLATGNMGEQTQGASDSPVTREEFEALKARVERIEGGQAVAA